jgi:hypothetical protein
VKSTTALCPKGTNETSRGYDIIPAYHSLSACDIVQSGTSICRLLMTAFLCSICTKWFQNSRNRCAKSWSIFSGGFGTFSSGYGHGKTRSEACKLRSSTVFDARQCLASEWKSRTECNLSIIDVGIYICPWVISGIASGLGCAMFCIHF